MYERWRKVGTRAAAVLAVAHVANTVLYLVPQATEGIVVPAWTAAYMEPIFYQDWRLFSPEPSAPTRFLRIRCEVDGRWLDWFHPLTELRSSHRRWRRPLVEKTLHLLRTNVDVLMDDVDYLDALGVQSQDVVEILTTTPEFDAVERIALAECRKRQASPTAVQISIAEAESATPRHIEWFTFSPTPARVRDD